MQSFIEINNVSKTYGNYKALNNISIRVPRQSIYGLLGPNGAGKTTLIRMLNQITAPDEGEIIFNGEKLNRSHITQIGYLPEERGLYRSMKVGEQAIYLAQLKGVSQKDAEKRLKAWFNKFGILNWWDKKVEELSKGMQQKIQFIVTVIHNPPLLIFDEPFSGFDPINVNLLKKEILELRDKGATIIFSTHNMSSVEELCDNIMLINKGQKVLEGSVYQIKQDNKDNSFEIVLRNSKPFDLPENFSLISEKTDSNGEITLNIKAENDINPNILINYLSEKGTIISYRELLPSMNDIFINKVNSL
ncbi:MAG: ATP-binding cassette domain-containing protein [Bacteroidales bacterium]|nr:ATP-binding cassette domain-containing protein [Bacteroidales bacterium]MBO5854867.1 ATP-binding cassette domain-containing protein [Bacteroidales bacterium]